MCDFKTMYKVRFFGYNNIILPPIIDYILKFVPRFLAKNYHKGCNLVDFGQITPYQFVANIICLMVNVTLGHVQRGSHFYSYLIVQ